MACGALSQDLSLPCGAAVGGVFQFFVTEFANLAASGVTISGNTATNAVSFLVKNTKFWLIPQKKESGTFTQTYTVNVPNGSSYYNQEVVISFPRLSANSQGMFQQMAQNDLMVIVQDMNNSYWLLGSNAGLTMSAGTAVTGKAKGDLNGFTVTIGDGGETYPMVQIPSALFAQVRAVAP